MGGKWALTNGGEGVRGGELNGYICETFTELAEHLPRDIGADLSMVPGHFGVERLRDIGNTTFIVTWVCVREQDAISEHTHQ